MATILASMLVMLGKPWLERFLCIGCLFLIRTGKHEIRCIVHQQAGRQPISFSSLFAATNDMECYDGSECLLLNICIQLMYRGRKKNQSLFLPVLSRIFIHVISCLCSFAFSSFISLSFHWFFLRGSTFRLFRFFFYFFLSSFACNDTIREIFGPPLLFISFIPSKFGRNFGICFQEIVRLVILTIVHTCGRAVNVRFPFEKNRIRNSWPFETKTLPLLHW